MVFCNAYTISSAAGIPNPATTMDSLKATTPIPKIRSEISGRVNLTLSGCRTVDLLSANQTIRVYNHRDRSCQTQYRGAVVTPAGRDEDTDHQGQYCQPYGE